MVKVITKEDFSKNVLKKMSEKKCTAMEAVVLLMEEYDLEIEYASKLIDKSLKETIESEAVELRLLKKTESLPI